MSDSTIVHKPNVQRNIVEVRNFYKTYRIGFWRKKIEAVRGISFSVNRGEIFGFLGPNGAGKTSTIKTMLGLMQPTQGDILLFGEPTSPRVRAKIGYLPENPYLYQYLKVEEFLKLCGTLSGLSGKDADTRINSMIEKVGLGHAKDRPIGKFSKGMMQRAGLAQALLHDPEFLILDEPMTGLDPVGRREVRELIEDEKRRGKTILFTSHILSDVEMLCDRVAIIQKGKITAQGTLDDLLRTDVLSTEVVLAGVKDAKAFSGFGAPKENKERGTWSFSVKGDDQTQTLIAKALSSGANIVSVTPERQTLEDLFLRDALVSK